MINERQARKYCKDNIAKIENYEEAKNDPNETWHLHHRLELTLDDDYAHSREDLKRLGMYYKRPYFELIFLTNAEHMMMHTKGENNNFYGKHHSDKTRKKMSESHRVENLSEESRKRMSESHKGKSLSAEQRRKIYEAAKRRYSKCNSDQNYNDRQRDDQSLNRDR